MAAKQIEITYCIAWGYGRRAAGLAALIQQHTGIAPVLKKGSGGVFDVVVDGQLIFSKHAEHRFPEDHEILDELE